MSKTLNLSLHCGGQLATMDDVYDVRTPNSTKTHTPIPHEEFLHRVKETLDFNGYEIVNEAHALARGGDQYFGLLQVEPHKGERYVDIGTVVGLRNCHGKVFPAGLVFGKAPFVCDNLCFCGEVKVARKHTSGIRRDLPELVTNAIVRLMDLNWPHKRRVLRYKAEEITDAAAHDLVIRSIDKSVVANAKIPEVLKAWREPEHEEFEERSVWSLYNAFTEVMKGSTLFSRVGTSQSLQNVMDHHCGISD